MVRKITCRLSHQCLVSISSLLYTVHTVTALQPKSMVLQVNLNFLIKVNGILLVDIRTQQLLIEIPMITAGT